MWTQFQRSVSSLVDVAFGIPEYFYPDPDNRSVSKPNCSPSHEGLREPIDPGSRSSSEPLVTFISLVYRTQRDLSGPDTNNRTALSLSQKDCEEHGTEPTRYKLGWVSPSGVHFRDPRGTCLHLGNRSGNLNSGTQGLGDNEDIVFWPCRNRGCCDNTTDPEEIERTFMSGLRKYRGPNYDRTLKL